MNMPDPHSPASRAAIPDNVPPDRFVDFDFMNPPGSENDVHTSWLALQAKPEIVWTPRHGGHWIATRAHVIEEIQKDHEHFSQAKGISLPLATNPVPLVPGEMDPPQHAPYRQYLNRSFKPSTIRQLGEDARELSVSLIEGFIDHGRCEFVAEFSSRLPTSIFLRFAAMPLADLDLFLGWVHDAIHGDDPDKSYAAFSNIADRLASVLRERKAAPRDDVMSHIAAATIDGAPISNEHALSMANNVFLGGLDTVTNMLSFFAHFLAIRPDKRCELIAEPALIPNAVDELIRRHAIVNTVRTLKTDYEFYGLSLRKDDVIMVPTTLHGLDAERYVDPLEVDFRREHIRHANFGNGPHRCIGAGLARVELTVFLEEWLRLVPEFELDPAGSVTMKGGTLQIIEQLPLVWG